MRAQASRDRLRVGLYFGDISHCSGLWEVWVYLLGRLGIRWMPLWDHSFLVKDLLRAVDVIVVPGGFSRNSEAAFGGETGRQNLRAAIERGVDYVGVCYGANVAMAIPERKGICTFGLVQGKSLATEGLIFWGSARIDYVCQMLDYRAESQETAHINGRMFGPGDYQILGHFSTTQPGPFQRKPSKNIAGRPAAITAKYGRGKVFLFSSHPEIPIPQYEDLLSKVIAGKIGSSQAMRVCWHTPKASLDNMRLLKSLFASLPAKALVDYGPVRKQWSAEHIAYLSTSRELLGSRLAESEQQLSLVFRHTKTEAMEFAQGVVSRRLRQARHVLRGLDVASLWDEPEALSQTATCLILHGLYCMCDHSGLYKEARMDYLVSQADRLRRLKANQRVRLEKKLARLVLKMRVQYQLDRFLYVGEGLKLQ